MDNIDTSGTDPNVTTITTTGELINPGQAVTVTSDGTVVATDEGHVIDLAPPAPAPADVPVPTEGAAIPRTLSPLDPDALSPVNATGYPTKVGNTTMASGAGPYVQKPMTPAKSQLLMEFENYLHGVPEAVENDKDEILAFVSAEFSRFRNRPAGT